MLENLTLVFKAGTTNAIVGPSGSGKSTIAYLVERFYDVDFGEVQVCGHNIKELDLAQLRAHIGYVGQEPVLFNQTIRQNIVNGLP